MLRIGDLFENEPEQWGLRGDQLLWQELKETLADQPAPENVHQLERLLENCFFDATGRSLSFSSEFFVERLAQENASRGGISGAIWRYRYFPLIVDRFEKAHPPV